MLVALSIWKTVLLPRPFLTLKQCIHGSLGLCVGYTDGCCRAGADSPFQSRKCSFTLIWMSGAWSALWLSGSRPLVPQDRRAIEQQLGFARRWAGPPPSRGGRDLLVLLSWCPFSSGWIDSCFCRSVRWVSHVFCDEVRGGGHTAWSESLHLCWKKTKMWAYD